MSFKFYKSIKSLEQIVRKFTFLRENYRNQGESNAKLHQTLQ